MQLPQFRVGSFSKSKSHSCLGTMQAWFPTGEPIFGCGSCVLDLPPHWPFWVGAGPRPCKTISYSYIRRKTTGQLLSTVTTLCWHLYIHTLICVWILEESLQAVPFFNANPPSSYNHCCFNDCVNFKENQVMQLLAKALKLTKPSGYPHF